MEIGARMTVVDKAYHQQFGADAVLADFQFTRQLTSDEQPFRRVSVPIGSEWTSLQQLGCWLEQSSMLFIVNEEGRWLQRVPAAADKADMDARIVEVALCEENKDASDLEAFAIVHPSTSGRFTPKDLRRIRLRCVHGKAKVTLNVFPV